VSGNLSQHWLCSQRFEGLRDPKETCRVPKTAAKTKGQGNCKKETAAKQDPNGLENADSIGGWFRFGIECGDESASGQGKESCVIVVDEIGVEYE